MRLPSVLSDIVSKMLRGKASKEEVQKFNSWYNKGIDTPWHIQDYKKRNKDQVQSEMLQNIQKATRSRIPDLSPKQSFLGWKIAASIIILIGVGLFATKLMPSENSVIQESKLLTFENGKGMIKKVSLPDGSAVSLFHDTKIQVSENFSENRLVILSGEAFFEVKRDTVHPFRVETSTLTTEVLGTSFLIKNIQDVQEIVAVKTGLVKVSDSLDSMFMLTPNLRLDYSDHVGTVSTMPISDPLFAWTEDILVFDETPMKEMVKMLEDWYGVMITTDLNASNTCRISGTYEKQSLENLLQLIRYSIPITYEINAKNVILTFKNCP